MARECSCTMCRQLHTPPSTEVAKKAFGGENVPYGAYVAMKTAQGNVVPWLASQTDILADDWIIKE